MAKKNQKNYQIASGSKKMDYFYICSSQKNRLLEQKKEEKVQLLADFKAQKTNLSTF